MMSRLNRTALAPAVYASRFALPLSRKTRFRLVADLYREGVEPSGSLRKVSDLCPTSSVFPLSQVFPVASWAHLRRKLIDAEKPYPQVQVALEWIGELYRVERTVRQSAPADLHGELAAARQQISRPLVDRLRDWLLHTPALSESLLGKAIRYADGLWPGLVRFLDDPRIPLDNNGAERALRGVVLGRKNHYGSKSKRGTEVAALFYSLLESAKLAGVEPGRYLAQATRRAIARPGTVTLPHDLRAGAPDDP